MQRIKKERNKEIMRRIKNKEYQVDIARDFNVSEARISNIKKYYLKKEKDTCA